MKSITKSTVDNIKAKLSCKQKFKSDLKEKICPHKPETVAAESTVSIRSNSNNQSKLPTSDLNTISNNNILLNDVHNTKSRHFNSDIPTSPNLTAISNHRHPISMIIPTSRGNSKCETISPTNSISFDYHLNTSDSPSSNNLFLYPLAINELANLSRNELTAIGLLPPEPPSSHRVKRQRPKRFHCPHCQVAFSNNGQLRGHIRIHTGERPFVCDQNGCDKSFTRNEELTRHRRIHTGLRPFPCTYCGKKFGRKDHLKKHTRTQERVMYTPLTPNSFIGYGHPYQPFQPPIISSSSSSPSPGTVSVASTLYSNDHHYHHFNFSALQPSSLTSPSQYPLL